jgi:hypothetical protein
MPADVALHHDIADAAAPVREFRILEVGLRISSDDAELSREFAAVFGGEEPVGGEPRVRISASVRARVGEGDCGELRISGDDLIDPGSFLLSFSSPTIPLRRLASPDATDVRVGLGDDPEPVFHFRGDDCRFRKVPRWRRIVSHFLFLRLLRHRPDLLFFHAASVGIAGQGVLLMGPKGTGKSTLSAALAARGHEFLGDETAAYQPSSGLLLPFRRPLAIKNGPKSAAIARALETAQPASDEDGVVRVPIESLVPRARATPLPLRAVVFLQGFAARPALARIQPGRDELSQMQPLASSLVDGATARVFEMIRLLGATACYRLHAGDADETTTLLEELQAS